MDNPGSNPVGGTGQVSKDNLSSSESGQTNLTQSAQQKIFADIKYYVVGSLPDEVSK